MLDCCLCGLVSSNQFLYNVSSLPLSTSVCPEIQSPVPGMPFEDCHATRFATVFGHVNVCVCALDCSTGLYLYNMYMCLAFQQPVAFPDFYFKALQGLSQHFARWLSCESAIATWSCD